MFITGQTVGSLLVHFHRACQRQLLIGNLGQNVPVENNENMWGAPHVKKRIFPPQEEWWLAGRRTLFA